MNTVIPASEGLKNPPKLKFKYPQNTYNIIIAQQSLPPLKHQYFFPIVDVSKRFEESLEKCRKKHEKQKMKIKAIEKVSLSRQLSENILEHYRRNDRNNIRSRCASESIESSEMIGVRNNRRASELVDQLLFDIYGKSTFQNGNSERIFETEYGSSTSFKSITDKFDEKLQYGRLILKDVTELRILIGALRERVTYAGNLLVKQLKKRDALKSKQEKICNVITAHLHAYSDKRSEDTNMRFSPNAIPGDSGFNQWRDAMKMVAKLPGGIPPEFRRKLWIALAERYLQSKGVNWTQTEKLCFNEWSNPDDSELGIQIVKDLHRTGCSLFCGAAGQENQALLKRVLLAYARWNKSVGYCQGFNMLAALILQVMDKNETDSVKVMIYLIEGVLPESYFANNLRGLSVDMIVFRDLLKIRLPLLSKHLEALQNDAREGNSYEPPLTNVFTMQWFLTLFCNCLPQATVLRVWDLIFLEGNEILLRTAIAIWEKLSDRILAVNSADEFYSIMGVLTREMLEFGLVDSNTLIKSVVAIGTCSELNEMRDRYLYNITPWTQSVQTAAKKGFKLFYSDDDEVESDYDEKAAVTAAYGISIGRKRDKNNSNSKEGTTIQPYAHGHPDRERLALDISALKKQYAKLRERQRQAHIILQAACARQPMGQNSPSPPIAMNHLLLGKSAIVNSRGRRLGPPKGSIPPARTKETVKKKEPVPSGETIQWKDTAKFRRRQSCTEESISSQDTYIPESDSSSYSEDDDSSTSTELCDEPGRMSDFDSDDKFSDILDSKRAVKSLKHNLKIEKLSGDPTEVPTDTAVKTLGDFSCSEVAEIQSEFSEIINDINKLKTVETNFNFNTSDTTDLSVNCELIMTSNPIKNEEIEARNTTEIPVKEEEDTFESFLQERVKILKENSSDSLSSQITSEEKLRRHKSYEETSKNHLDKPVIFKQKSFDIGVLPTIETSLWTPYQIEEESPKEETIDLQQNAIDETDRPKEASVDPCSNSLSSRRSSEEKLRRHKSYEETSNNTLEKSVIFKQKSIDIGVLPTIETSLWKPYQIEEESPKEETTNLQQNAIEEADRPKEASVDLLTVEDKRLESGRRNSERALKIIQENSLILHRILQQQKSSEKEDSEDELSRSPITFLRSESLLSKDEKTDEERSSKDGDDELESCIDSFSMSPALLDEESDRSVKKDTFEDQDETLIISKIEDTEYSYKYQSSDNTSNIVSSSIFEETNLQTEIVDSFSHTTFEDYSPNMCEESVKNNEDKLTTIEDKIVEDSEEINPYKFSFKYTEESDDNIVISSTKIEESNIPDQDKHELLSFLSSNENISSNNEKEDNLLLEEKSKYLLYDSSSNKEETKSYFQDSKEDMISFKISEDDEHNTNLKSLEKGNMSSLTKEETKSYLPDSKEDFLKLKISADDEHNTKHKSFEKGDISSLRKEDSKEDLVMFKISGNDERNTSLGKEETNFNLSDSKEDMPRFNISKDYEYSPKNEPNEKDDISSLIKEETKFYLPDCKEDIFRYKIAKDIEYSLEQKPYKKDDISSPTKEETKSSLVHSKEDILSLKISEDDEYNTKHKSLEKDNFSSLRKEETKSYHPDSNEEILMFKISEDDKYISKHKPYNKDDISSLKKEETKTYLEDSKVGILSYKISEDDKYTTKPKLYEEDDISSVTKVETKEDMLSYKISEDDKYSPKHKPHEEDGISSLTKEETKKDMLSYKISEDDEPKTKHKLYYKDDISSLTKEETKSYLQDSREDICSYKIFEVDKYSSKHKPYEKGNISSLTKEETKSYLPDSKEDMHSYKVSEDDKYSIKHEPYKIDAISSLTKEETKTYFPESNEDKLNFKLSRDYEYSPKNKSFETDGISSFTKEETRSYLPDSKEDMLNFKISDDDEQKTTHNSFGTDDISSLKKEETKSYLSDFKEDMLNFKIPENVEHKTKHKSFKKDYIPSLKKEETLSYLLESKEDMLDCKISEDDKYTPKHRPYKNDNISSPTKDESKSYLLDSKEDMLVFKISEDEDYRSRHKPYKQDDITSLSKEKPESKEDMISFKISAEGKDSPKHKSFKEDDISSLTKEASKSYLPDSKEDTPSLYKPKRNTYGTLYKKEDPSSSSSKEDSFSFKIPEDNYSEKPKTYNKSYEKEDLSSTLPKEETQEDTGSYKIPEEKFISKQDTYEKEDLSSLSCTKSPEHSSPYKYRFHEDSKYSIYLQNEEPTTSSSKYAASLEPNKADTISSSSKIESCPNEQLSSEETLDKYSKFSFASKYELNSPEYITQRSLQFSSVQSNSASPAIVKSVGKLVTDSTDNNSCEVRSTSPEYQYNKNKLSIELAPSKYGEYSPEISPPKNLSCLQFTTDIPCTSKSIQFSPICTKDNNEKSPKKSPKYFSSFNLPTLSPPRRTVKSPLSPNKTFSPFPVQPTTRQPKELGVKLGLYKDLSPLKSPTK